MKESIIFIKRNSFILDGEEYNFDRINEVKCMIKSYIKIIILEEELYVKKFANKVKKLKAYDFINFKITNDFPQNGDLLYDYIISRKDNMISIYSIRGAKRIMKLVESAKEIEIKPIQLLIKEILVKILKNKNVTAKILFKYKEVYYYLSFEEGMFNHGFIEEKKSLILNRILSSSEGGDIYVDEDTIDVIPSENKINLLKLNVGELINEKIFKKQVFHSRRFL